MNPKEKLTMGGGNPVRNNSDSNEAKRQLVSVSHIENRTVTISLANPPLNVITTELTKQLLAGLKQYRENPDINVVVIRGEGRCFSAGADIKEHLPDQVSMMLSSFKELMIEMLTHPKVTVAAVHGYAMGGGFELAIATDFLLAAEDARFSLPEIRLGVFPPVATAWLPYMTDYKTANKLVLTGCELKPEVLKEMGLVNHVIKPAEFDSSVKEFCDKFTGMSGVALQHAKRSMKSYQDTLTNALNISIDSYLNQLMQCKDPVEGLKSFMEKRKPVWKHK